MPGIQLAPSSGQNWSSSSSSSSHDGATERCQVFKWRHLPNKTGYHHHHMVAPRAVPGIQVPPSSGQNWSSSSSSHDGATERCQVFKWRHLPNKTHGGATERCQVFKWRHLPDKTGYHHHMVAPLSGVSSSSGVIFLTKTGYHHGGATELCQVFKWRHISDKTGYRHYHMVAPLSGVSSSSGAIFRTKLVIIITTWWRH